MTFKNKIAFHYLIATASVIAVVFFIIYLIISTTVYYNLDTALFYEAQKHLKDVTKKGDTIGLNEGVVNTEREHMEAEVLPFFLQLVGLKGNILWKSDNLNQQELIFVKKYINGKPFNTELNHQAIRQVQVPVIFNGEKKGYLLIAVSLEGTIRVINNLKNVLFILFPVSLVLLFFVARFLADKSIKPITAITETANRITKNNLNERVPLPEAKDELYTLSAAINDLLDRMQNAFEREKQFTDDASHELRTPLSVIKGTLEVLVRKPRTEEEYREKIKYCISEIDNMSERVDQLLLLARFDKANITLRKESLPVLSIIDNSIHRYRKDIEEKKLTLELSISDDITIFTDPYYVDIIFENIFSNAVKYSPNNGKIEIKASRKNSNTILEIIDYGGGITEKDFENVFNPFFRSESLKHKHIGGSGLGLSIVKKAAELLNVSVDLKNHKYNGLKVTLTFSD